MKHTLTYFLLVLSFLSPALAQGHGTFSGYLKQVNSDGFRHKFAVTPTDVTFTFTGMGVSIGTPAVDDGSGTCGTNFYVEALRGYGTSQAVFVPAGQTLAVVYFSPAFTDSSNIAYLSAQQVGGCISPAGDINLTAKYTY